MRRFEPGDQVRVDIPDTADPDFDQFHGRHGEVVDVLEDDAGHETGDNRDAHLFTVEFEDGSTHGFSLAGPSPSIRGVSVVPISRKVEETCPRCGDDSDVWMFEKPEGSVTKECYTCETCECEWSEIIDR